MNVVAPVNLPLVEQSKRGLPQFLLAEAETRGRLLEVVSSHAPTLLERSKDLLLDLLPLSPGTDRLTLF